MKLRDITEGLATRTPKSHEPQGMKLFRSFYEEINAVAERAETSLPKWEEEATKLERSGQPHQAIEFLLDELDDIVNDLYGPIYKYHSRVPDIEIQS